MRKELYEWVMVFSKGDDFFLTENQFAFYMEHWKEGQMKFNNFLLNPSFVVQSYRRRAQELYLIYPCETCHTTGHTLKEGSSGSDGEFEECKNCLGTGVDFKK